jgi:hypothetical protein
VDDTQRDGDKTLSALISEVSAGFQIGTQQMLVMELKLGMALILLRSQLQRMAR